MKRQDFYFQETIQGWDSWRKVYRSTEAFTPLVRRIFQQENLPFRSLETCAPSTNAVFQSGDYMIKLYVPKESGLDCSKELQTELFCMERLQGLGITVPNRVASRQIADQYTFFYLITERVDGVEFCKINRSLTIEQKEAFGKRLRLITDQMNTPCEPFNDIDVIKGPERYQKWRVFPESLQAERRKFIARHAFGELVFVHGDLCSDNLLVTGSNEICLIDFADASLAPLIYEQALVAGDLFEFDPAYLRGYFGEGNREALLELCFSGLLLHDLGGDIVAQQVAPPEQVTSLKVLWEKLRQILV